MQQASVMRKLICEAAWTATKKCGVWRYLTNKWLTFRSKDNANATRRTTEPGWKVVQDLAERFGPVLSVGRRIRGMSTPSRQKYVQLIAGCLPGYAARLGRRDLQPRLLT